jgi:hypothetical protein
VVPPETYLKVQREGGKGVQAQGRVRVRVRVCVRAGSRLSPVPHPRSLLSHCLCSRTASALALPLLSHCLYSPHPCTAPAAGSGTARRRRRRRACGEEAVSG